jgi:hypothetical protein
MLRRVIFFNLSDRTLEEIEEIERDEAVRKLWQLTVYIQESA